jgi:predicted nucleic acid-binding protein
VERFVVDTNVFVHAIRSPAARGDLAAWQRIRAPHIWQHAVVVSELLVGATDAATWERWHRRWVEPAERLHRIVIPGYGAWLRASRIMHLLAERGRISAGGVKPSFYNDCLLAAGARDHGHVIVTHNRADFELIGEVEPALKLTEPFP